MNDLVLTTPHAPAKVLAILEREMDAYPGVLRTIVTLNAHYFSGTALVCGRVRGRELELRNRSAPFLSVRATGTVDETAGGSRIVLSVSRPPLPDLAGMLVGRYERDLEVIVGFLERTLEARVERSGGTKTSRTAAPTESDSR